MEPGRSANPGSKPLSVRCGIIISSLVVMLAGIAFLAERYRIVATDPDSDTYQSVLSMLFAAVSGRGWFYYIAIASVLIVLIFSANTAFADFPRVCHILAEDWFTAAVVR